VYIFNKHFRLSDFHDSDYVQGRNRIPADSCGINYQKSERKRSLRSGRLSMIRPLFLSAIFLFNNVCFGDEVRNPLTSLCFDFSSFLLFSPKEVLSILTLEIKQRRRKMMAVFETVTFLFLHQMHFLLCGC